MKRILVVVAHPDDETLGCGAIIAREATDPETVVRVMTFTDGVSSRYANAAPLQEKGSRQTNFVMALHALGVFGAADLDAIMVDAEEETYADARGAGWTCLSGVDQQLASAPVSGLADNVADEIASFRPDVVFTHWPHDLNSDHRAVAEAVMIAARPRGEHVANAVYACEILSSTECGFGALPPFVATRYEVVGPEAIDKKIAALRGYQDECRPQPHPRSVRAVMALAQLRGSQVHARYAEAFAVLLEVSR